jgi:hypothetical protein
MVETVSSLLVLSDATAELVERAAGSIVSVNSGGRWHSSGIHWRSGINVTAARAVVGVVSRGGLCLRTRRTYCSELICCHGFVLQQ